MTLRFYNGAEPEDPMAAFAAFADELGLAGTRVGMEVPGGYPAARPLHRLKAMLGDRPGAGTLRPADGAARA